MVLEDAQLVIGQLNRAHAPIITRNPIPIHPECAPRGGRPSPRRAELTAVYLVSYLLWVARFSTPTRVNAAFVAKERALRMKAKHLGGIAEAM